MAYFTYFPVVNYDVRGDKNDIRISTVTNILARVRKKLEITNAGVFEQYFINDGDRADTLAYEFYNDSTLHWLIMYANYMTNPYYDWPLNYNDLNKFIAKKYTDVNGVNHIYDAHHYEDAKGKVVDQYPQTFDAGGFSEDRTGSGFNAISNFVYEEKLNDAKRTIDIIKNEFVPQIIREFKQFIIE